MPCVTEDFAGILMQYGASPDAPDLQGAALSVPRKLRKDPNT